MSLYLNETGGLIWELCNGQRSTADIIALLTEIYLESREQIVADVLNIIVSLQCELGVEIHNAQSTG